MMKMKTALTVFTIALLSGCASYTTNQLDTQYEITSSATNSALASVTTNAVRTTTTRVTVRTFFNAKSDLAKSTVTNTDKSQSSKVGSLNQQATNNVEQVVRIVIDKAP